MKKQLKFLLMGSAFFNLAAGLFAPVYAIFVEGIGGSAATAGFAYGIFSLVAGIMILVLGKLEDKIVHQEKLIFVGYLLASLTFLSYIFVETPTHLYLIQILFGLSIAIGDPSYFSMFTTYIDHGKYASQWGMWEAMYWLFGAASGVIGGILVNLYGFRTLFTIMFIISLLPLITSLMLMKSIKEK